VIALLLALALSGPPHPKTQEDGLCEKPIGKLPGPVLAPIECMDYEGGTCSAACYWPGRPDGGAWDDVVRASAPTKAGCRKLLEEACAAKRGAPR